MSAPSLARDSLAEIPEEKLVDRIVTDTLWGREFFSALRYAIWNGEKAVRIVGDRPRQSQT